MKLSPSLKRKVGALLKENTRSGLLCKPFISREVIEVFEKDFKQELFKILEEKRR